MAQIVKSGIDVLAAQNFQTIRGARVAVVANQASVDMGLEHAVDRIVASSAATLVRIFAPEHGFRGAWQDMELVRDQIDPITGVPVVSLYGSSPETFAPSEEYLRDIEVLIFDLQDVGARYYTFVQTLALCMKVCGKVGVKVLVLDRVNPINGVDIEGGDLDKSCHSFCGYAPIANRHGLTPGEYGLLVQKGFGTGESKIDPINCELEVVRVEGWKREMFFDETGLPWVLPSPNMPTLDTAIVYPGMCLFEATELSEARGTTRPFEFIGAPYINGYKWKECIAQQGIAIDGCILRPAEFIPTSGKCKGQSCGGVQVHVTDRKSFRSYALAIAMLAATKELYPDDFKWREKAYEFVKEVPAIDLLYGSSKLRNYIDSGKSVANLMGDLTAFETRYQKERTPFLLY